MTNKDLYLYSQLRQLKGHISAPSKYQAIQALVRSNTASDFYTVHESQITSTRGANTLTWDILGINHDTPSDSQYTRSMTLRLQDQWSAAMQFDAPEAFYYAENRLAAGDFYFTIDSTYDTSYNDLSAYGFTLPEAVPTGAVMTFPWAYGTNASTTKVYVYASRESATPIMSVSVSESTSGTNLGELKNSVQAAANLNSINRVRYGSNNYKESAIRQWLKSDKPAGQVWTPQTPWDRPPEWVATADGFMRGMDADFLATIGKTHIITARVQTIEGGAAYDEMDDYFFLLSKSQVYGGAEVAGVDEGAPYPYYSDYSELSAPGVGVDANRILTRNSVAAYYWLRTPYSGYDYIPRNVVNTGNVGISYASVSNGVAPACNII